MHAGRVQSATEQENRTMSKAAVENADADAGLETVDSVSRIMLGIVSAAALALGLMLWIGASRTGDFFAWTILSPTSASALGGFYVGIGLFAGMAARAPGWYERQAVFPAAITGPALLLIPTAIHHFLFHFDHPLAWAWLILYILFPPMLVFPYLAGLRYYRRTPRASHPAAGIGFRPATSWLTAAVLGTVGVWLLIAPDSPAIWWGWPITPLLGRVYGCWLIAGAIEAAAVALVADWKAVRLAMRAQVAFSICCIAGPLLHPIQLRTNLGAFLWFAVWAGLGLYALILLWLNREPRPS
jgi:hypothetical protein